MLTLQCAMYKVSIEPHWRIAYGKNAAIDTALLLRLLSAIQSQGAIIQAAKTVNLSYRHAWGLLREAESIFGGALLDKQRGRGTLLTHLATTLLWADRRITARLSPTLESLSSELETELGKSVLGTSNTVRMMARHGFATDACFLPPLAEAAEAEVARRLTAGERPDAVIVSNGLMLLGLYRGVRRAGFETPRDIAIAGFDNEIWTELVGPGLTVIEQPVAEIGRAAMDLLFERLRTPDMAM